MAGSPESNTLECLELVELTYGSVCENRSLDFAPDAEAGPDQLS